LLIESERASTFSFATPLKRKYHVQIAHSGPQGISLASTYRPDVVIVDAASLHTAGDRICARLRAALGELPIIHIRAADSAAKSSRADVVLTQPFTIRKLTNRIGHLVVVPEEESKVLEAGPFSLNLEQQTLVTPWNETKLTPKLVLLMGLFIQHREQTLERKEIMQRVWETDYVGDTRTLDVHIRWLRKIVEPNPRKPQYITTVRGLGYRFVVPDTIEAPAEAELESAAEQPGTG